MSSNHRTPQLLIGSVLLSVAALLAGCGGGARVYDAHGVVQDVNRPNHQVVIDHRDIPGLMPAMTMSFDVADSTLLETLAPGQEIDFKLSHDGNAYRVVAATVLRDSVATSADSPHVANVAAEQDPAPPFHLIDENGDSLSLDHLRGHAVLLDFIYTNCPGPCPILTSLHVDVQRHLDPALRDRVRFVSITIDPVRDTPPALRRYATERGADLASWSFLTGQPDTVAAVVRAYGVGTIRKEDGNISHLVVTFLIDGGGRIVHRYIGLDDDPKAVRADLERLARSMPAPRS